MARFNREDYRTTLPQLEQEVKALKEQVETLVEMVNALYNEYGGDYIVAPQPRNDVVLETRNTVMREDTTVLKIPYESVTNETGGETVTIGGY